MYYGTGIMLRNKGVSRISVSCRPQLAILLSSALTFRFRLVISRKHWARKLSE